MWMHFFLKKCRDGSGISLSSFVILCWCHISVNADITNAAASHSPENVVAQEIFPTSDNSEKCSNMTSDINNGLSVVDHESAYPFQPTVPPPFLTEALTCQPYRGIYVNHIYFQLANAFFLLSHLAPSGIHGVLYLRCTLLIGCAFLTLWGWTIVCWMDAAMWNGLFVIINFFHVCTLLYRLRPIKFSKEIEEVYAATFQPLRVSRHQFKKILSCMKIIRQLKYQEVYAQEKVTKVDSLSLVLSGKLVVSQNGRALHIVFPHQFLDSPEWFGVSTDEYFQVSITAMEESRILLWHRDKLKLSIMSDQFLQAVFDHILGRDVVKKLMQVSETMAAGSHHNQNGQIVGFGGMGNLENEQDTKLFVVKKSSDNHGITALISRQLQGLPRIRYYYCASGDPNAWRLGRIEETDHETSV